MFMCFQYTWIQRNIENSVVSEPSFVNVMCHLYTRIDRNIDNSVATEPYKFVNIERIKNSKKLNLNEVIVF